MATDINYSRPTEMTYLACPDPSDSLETVAAKMNAIMRVTAQGNSVAVHMGYLDGYTMDTAEDVEAAVVAREMTATEKLHYTAWKSRSWFPGFDFETFVIDVTRDAAAITRYGKLVEAMRIVWSTDNATPRNAAYVSLYMQHLIPLLFGVMKIEKAKKKSRWGFPRDPSALDKVEAETIQKVTDIASGVRNEVLKSVKVSARQVLNSKVILMARKRNLNCKAANEVDDNSTRSNTTQPQPQQDQEQQGQPQSSGSIPLPRTPTTNHKKRDTPDAMAQTSSKNKRETQTSEGNPPLPRSKSRKMSVRDEAVLGTLKDTGAGTTAATTQPVRATPLFAPEYRYMQSRFSRNPISIHTGLPVSAPPTNRQTTQTSSVPAKKNFKKPTVSDARESEDGD